jgi:choline dehydrogenase-like flavoprotein
MIEDLRPAGPGDAIETDLCIIGAGAAGITLAREFSGRSTRVLLIEGGGLQADAESQTLYRGESAGPLPYDLASSRMRFFGGSTNCWAGFCAPLSSLDLAPRPWVPHSGWPIGVEALAPHYPRAQKLLDLGPFDYSTARFEGDPGGMLRLDPAKLANRMWQRSPPTRFNSKFRRELEASANLRVLLRANALELIADRDGKRVTGLRLAAPDGTRALVRARGFVLATGGIENARLLLLSRASQPRGLGNRHDLVGRFFMEHPLLLAASVAPGEAGDWSRAYADFGLPGGGRGTAGIAPSDAAQRSQGILDAIATLNPGRVDPNSGSAALERLWDAFERRDLPDDWSDDALRVLADLDDALADVYHHFQGVPHPAPMLETDRLSLVVHVEQAPDPENRITLGEEKDALGLPRARLRWGLGELERRTAERVSRLIAEELGRLGRGRLRLDEWLLSPQAAWPAVPIKCHHIGTTRMSDDPRQGVVDRECRVHGIENLWIAGSSVFPTSGFANPTLTILALTLRLASHLRERFPA